MLFIYLLNVPFSRSLFPNSVGIAVCSFVCSFPKRLSSWLLSEVLPLSNSTILSGRTGRYEEVDDRLSFSLASLEASRVCYPASRGPSIFLDKSGRGDLSRKIEGPLLAW